MRSAVIVAAAFAAMGLAAISPRAAQAEEYCGYSARPGAIVECGYSSVEGCEHAIGKGAMCFVSPYVAFNTRRVGPLGATGRAKTNG